MPPRRVVPSSATIGRIARPFSAIVEYGCSSSAAIEGAMVDKRILIPASDHAR